MGQIQFLEEMEMTQTKSWNLTENLLIKTWTFNPYRTPSTTITVGDINWRIKQLISSKNKGTSEEITGERFIVIENSPWIKIHIRWTKIYNRHAWRTFQKPRDVKASSNDPHTTSATSHLFAGLSSLLFTAAELGLLPFELPFKENKQGIKRAKQ